MKAIIIIFLVVTCFGHAIFAQDFGIQAGANFASVSSSEDIVKSNLLGYNFGIGIKAKVIGKLNFETGLLFSERGNKFEWQGLTKVNRTRYFDIPLHVVLELGNEKSGVILFAGPYFSYGFQSRITDDDGNIINGYDSASYVVSRFDGGVDVGAGFDFSRIRLKLTFSFGMKDTGYFQASSSQNRVVNLSAAYFFEND